MGASNWSVITHLEPSSILYTIKSIIVVRYEHSVSLTIVKLPKSRPGNVEYFKLLGWKCDRQPVDPPLCAY